MSIQREHGPFFDAQAIAEHDMALEEAGEDFCPDYRTCWICQKRDEGRDDTDRATDGRIDWRDSHG